MMPPNGAASLTGMEVLRRILEREGAGVSLRCRAVRSSDRALANAAVRCFGSWGKALAAAGIDAEVVAHRRMWAEDRVIRRIRQLAHDGIPLNYASMQQKDFGVVQAAQKRFGRWDNALRSAGFDPMKIRLTRRPWTRVEIIHLIRSHADAKGTANPSDVLPLTARLACPRLFGSWKNAFRKAGAPCAARRWPMWSRSVVIEAIHARLKAGEPVHCSAVAREAAPLYDAARRYFGKWELALKTARIVPETVRRARRPWTPSSVVEEIRRRTASGMDMGQHPLQPVSLVRAVRRFFGSWQNALEAARPGLAAADHRVPGSALPE